MQNNSNITEIIYETIDDINEQLPKNKKLGKTLETTLYGKEGKLDSLGLVNLIVNVEEKIFEELNISLTLANEKALSMKNSPFSTIGSLTEYILALIEDKSNE